MPEGRLTPLARDRGLRAIFPPIVFVGLTTASGEVTDANYRRQELRLSEPYEEGGVLKQSNDEVVRFAGFAADADQPVRGWFIADAPDGGHVLAEGLLERPKLPSEGEEMFWRPGALRVGLR